MPAEKVYGEQRSQKEVPPMVPIVDVRWNREGGYVQIVTKVEDPFGGRFSDDEGIHYTDGMYVDLGRKEINQLIRNLRRARDQAFGRDE